MSYIWKNYSDDKRYELSSEENNIGIETGKEINNTIPVNVLVRLYDVFFPQGYINSENSLSGLIEKYTCDTQYMEIFNFLVHVHAMFDKYSGMTVQDVIAMCVEKKIQENVFGEEIKECYLSCDDNVRYHLLNYYARMVLSEGTADVFENFIETVFKNVNLYYEKATNMSIIYIHNEKSTDNLAVVRLASYFLCRMNRNVVVLWKGEHMPIIDEDFSMIIDDMCISF
ncbi:MAG: hypothetical protein IJN05_06400 [Ruminococcus sp.]|nr:hypothetical protein [Ruminococcus sp.]